MAKAAVGTSPTPEPPEIVYTTYEFAKILKVSVPIVRQMIKSGRLRAVYPGPRSPRIPASEARRLAENSPVRRTT